MDHENRQPPDDLETLVDCYSDLLFRICLITLGNEADAEDTVQETFLRRIQKAPVFTSAEHEKAWLITVAVNQCKDQLRFRKRHPQADSETLSRLITPETESSGILDALMTLPEKFRLVLTLYYVQDYDIGQIARIIQRTPSAVKMRLQKGRRLLKEAYRKEYEP